MYVRMYELPPIQRKLVFDNYANIAINLCHPWHAFKMTEPTEIMGQKNTNHLLNFWVDLKLDPRTMNTSAVFSTDQ